MAYPRLPLPEPRCRLSGVPHPPVSQQPQHGIIKQDSRF